MSRRHARVAVLQTLFAHDLGRARPEDALALATEENALDEAEEAFARQLLEGTLANREAIDREISRRASGWQLDRIAGVERNILRVAIFELNHAAVTPARVIIDEAVELARAFGSEESGSFVNGVLDALAREQSRSIDQEAPPGGDEWRLK